MKIFFTSSLILLFSIAAFAQTNATIEKDLVAAVNALDKYSTYGGNYDEAKLNKANSTLETKLLKYAKMPATLAYKFPKLAETMRVITSEDGKLRIYDWDMMDGGTMHNYARVYQYKGTDGKVYAMAEPETGDAGGNYAYSIHTVTTKSGPVYIVCGTFRASGADHFQSADLFKITGAKLTTGVKLIKTKSGLTHTLGFEYNPFSIEDTEKEDAYELIKFDKKTNTLTIPVVIEDTEYPNGKITNGKISYRFDGTNFVKVN